jgi:hypothetical protein
VRRRTRLLTASGCTASCVTGHSIGRHQIHSRYGHCQAAKCHRSGFTYSQADGV